MSAVYPTASKKEIKDGSARPTAQLAILPGMTHYDILSFPGLADIVTAFLDAPMQEAK